MSLRKAVLPRGWVRQELGMQGNFPVLLLLKPVRCGSSDSPRHVVRLPLGRSSMWQQAGAFRAGGRKCLPNECLGGGERRGRRYRPGGLSAPGISVQIPDGISSGLYSWALGQPAPSAGPGREDAASVLESGGFATTLSGLEVQGWLAKLSVTPQSPLRSPTLDPLQPVLRAGFILVGRGGCRR